MNIPYEQPHLLFPLAAYFQSQYEFIDQFIPELASSERKLVHLTNFKQFEDLLYHLESTFLVKDEIDNGENIETYLKIPSIGIFRVLITLASRCLSTYFTHGSPSIDGLIANNEYTKNLNEEYEKCIYKPPLRDRCIMIMRRYMDILITSTSPTTVELVYKLFLDTFKEFIIQPEFFHIKGTLPKDRYLRSKRKIALRQETNVEESHEVISDSEEEPPSLVNDIASEVKKFQPYNISPLKRNTGIFSGDNYKISGLNDSSVLFQTMPHLDSESDLASSSEGELSSKRRKGSSNRYSKDSILNNVRVFGDYLISRQLNPMINSPYNLWKLIQWTFHCADFSTMYQKKLLGSNCTNSHLIFETYSKLLRLIFDFLQFNLIYHLIKDQKSNQFLNIERKDANEYMDPVFTFSQLDSTSRKEIIGIIENDRSILLLNLMMQLGPSQVDWYDRVIEYVFTGLNKDKPNSESSYQPQPCYEREKILTRHDNTLKKEIDRNYALQYDDNIDSMKLRYGIIIIIYYRSLFFATESLIDDSQALDDSPTSPLSPKLFLQQLSCKLITLDYLYLRQFYLAYYMETTENKFITRIYQYQMMHELTKMMLISFTGFPEIENYLSTNEIIHSNSNSAKNLMDLIVDQRLYQALVEDETYSGWQDFELAWSKLNYLLGWLLESSLAELQNNLRESSEDIELVNFIFKRVEKADRIKIKWYNRFILNHCKDNNKSNNNHVEYHFYLSDDEALNHLVNDKSETIWVRFKHVVLLKFSKYINEQFT